MLRKIFRFIGVLFAILAGLIVLLAGYVYFRSGAILNQTYTTPPLSTITIPYGDPAAIERGRYLTAVVSACLDCHGQDFGGKVFVDDPVLGRIVAPNLTSGENGLGRQRTDEDLMRVLRYGVKHDSTSVRVMPADDYSHFDDADLGAVIAYLRSLPPVNSDLPETELRPVGRALLAFGQLDIMIAPRIDFAEAGSPPQTAGVTLEYGTYLGNIAGCTGCHGPGLSGGPIPGAPPEWPIAMNLTPSGELAGWTEADFINTIRTGTNPNGYQLRTEMPWQTYRNMSDDELKAIWLFLQSVPAKEAGNR
ncbi:MAG: hypothetical protein Fur0022_42670 [Anaerolineales bacterium]